MSVIFHQQGSMKLMDKPQKHYGKNGFQYKPQYGVVVICDDENHQQHIYETLKNQGLKLKVVTV